jgi:anti-sigma B factor antagonist
MQLDKQDRGGVSVITLTGRLDSGSAPAVQDELSGLIPDRGLVLLDLSGLDYMSSAGLRVLLLAYRQAQRTGARLALAGLSAEVRSVMAATGFLDFFAVADTVDDGVEALTA